MALWLLLWWKGGDLMAELLSNFGAILVVVISVGVVVVYVRWAKRLVRQRAAYWLRILIAAVGVYSAVTWSMVLLDLIASPVPPYVGRVTILFALASLLWLGIETHERQ